jgi:gamma-glutamylcyclotransferase (GGCT)/AIG2-like uncharacterized protein YtfP
VTELFVYGTLVPGAEAWPHLERRTEGEPRLDAVAGQLYDTGRGYPGATFDPAAPGWVQGVVVMLAQPDTEALAALDRYEGDEYERVLVRTAGGREVFTYAWIAPLDRLVPVVDGRWRA